MGLVGVEVEVAIEIWEVGAKEDETGQGKARCASRTKTNLMRADKGECVVCE